MNKKKDSSPFEITDIKQFYKLFNILNSSDNFYLYRGQWNENFGLESSWLRYHTIDKKNKNYVKDAQMLRDNILIFNQYINKIRENNKYKNMDALEILASLQHSKDVPTPLIDLTDDLLLALWFALSEYKADINATIFIMEVDHSTIRKNMKSFTEKTIDQVFESPYVSNRVLSQRSYFIIDYQNWENSEKIIKIIINKKLLKGF